MVSLLTPTGARPEAFTKCVEYMKAQTYTGPVRWIILDDGPDAMETPKIKGWDIIHIRPEPLWKPGQNTQQRNLLEGLNHHIKNEKLIIIEDDDLYASWWLEVCNKRLESYDLIGEAPSLYRHLNGEEKLMNNYNHASLCTIAMKGPVINEFKRVVKNYKRGIDIHLWRRCQHMKKRIFPFEYGVVGIKGYPGRPGIGVGHKLKELDIEKN
jgi:hypothetical protein